jgi:phage shock protein PspC (stress-responsive transcriptional regulator)
VTGPSRRDRTRPAEILGLAAGAALFLGLGVLLVTRDWILALEAFGGGFVIAIVVLATLLLAVDRGPKKDDSGPPDPSAE